MSFTIVQTIENGQYLVSSVPHKWVSNGVLSWPQSKAELNKNRTIVNSEPEISWLKFPCVIKRSGILSYKEAIRYEKQMLEVTNSESDANIRSQKSVIEKRKAHMAGSSKELEISQLINYDDFFESSKTTPAESSIPEEQSDEVDIHHQIPEADEVYVQDWNIDCGNFEQRLTKLETLASQMNAKIDKVLTILENPKSNGNNVNVAMPDILKSFPFPLTEVSQVEEFESKLLLEDDYKKKIIFELQRMNGTSGNLDGKKVCYKLMDWLFDRKLLIQYTWTGSSKTKNKNPFLVLKQITDVVFQIVNSADCKFNFHMLVNFLKINILKYSESRSQQNKPEISSQKRKTKSSKEKVCDEASVAKPDEIGV